MTHTKMTEQQMRLQLAQNLCYLRKLSKPSISQIAFSRIMNLPLKTIRNYESGNSSPAAYDIYCLSKYYGYTMEELLTQKLYEERKNRI